MANEDFCGDKEWLLEVCRLLKLVRRPEWEISSFANARDFSGSDGPALAKTMAEAGITEISIGVESNDPQVLKHLSRTTNTSQVKHLCDIAAEAGIDVWGSIMLGYPWQSEAALLDDLRITLSLPLSGLYASMLMPFPGTDIYHECREKGFLENLPFQHWTGEEPVIKTPVDRIKLMALRLQCLSHFDQKNK